MATQAYIPEATLGTEEVLVGKTVTGSSTNAPQGANHANSNDRNFLTSDIIPGGVVVGTGTSRWHADLLTAYEVTRIRVWDPIGADWWPDAAGAVVQWSDDGSSWTTAARTFSSATVSTGLSPPYATTTTEYRYTLNTPVTHRYWRIAVSYTGFHSGTGMGEWFIDANTSSDTTWVIAPDTIDGDVGSCTVVDSAAITDSAGAFWRASFDSAQAFSELNISLGLTDSGATTIFVQGGDLADYSDQATVITIDVDATGSLTTDDITALWDSPGAFQYWQLVLDGTAQDVSVCDVALSIAAESPPTEPGKAILEIYVHDEDASRWGIATWATGPATGTEGIWSAAGWTDITPEGVLIHAIGGSRRPSRGILHTQDGASWNVQTYDPDRILDPGNFDSPYYPQLVAGLPIRFSHDSTVIRTGYVDEMSYNHRAPYYQGQILATDTIALLHKASVPADSILGDTLLERIQDAINSAGISVGGIPLPPGGPAGPALAEWVEGAATDEGTSVWKIIQDACLEVLWVPFVTADAGLGLRPWGSPLDRGREIGSPNLEDLRSFINEDGVYSVARVQVSDPDLDPIERVAAPLPRYGRRLLDRREPTIDAEGWATTVLAERSWPGVQYVPGTVHCFTAADVEYFGTIETMERVTIVTQDVSVQGRVLGSEVFVEHRGSVSRGATWMFNFAVATEGATAVGLTTLVSDQSGEPLLDDMTDTDFLEAD